MARELIIQPRFKRDYRSARKHPEFDAETLEYVFDVMISGGRLPDALRDIDSTSAVQIGPALRNATLESTSFSSTAFVATP